MYICIHTVYGPVTPEINYIPESWIHLGPKNHRPIHMITFDFCIKALPMYHCCIDIFKRRVLIVSIVGGNKCNLPPPIVNEY